MSPGHLKPTGTAAPQLLPPQLGNAAKVLTVVGTAPLL